MNVISGCEWMERVIKGLKWEIRQGIKQNLLQGSESKKNKWVRCMDLEGMPNPLFIPL